MTTRSLGRGRRLALLLGTATLALGVSAGTASAATTTFSNPGVIAILDESQAVPYPSEINVSGLAAPVQKATVKLHSFRHTFPNDIAVLLVGPTGANSILMGRVGGDDDTGVIDLTFDQAATATLNETDLATSGTYQPSQDATVPNPFSPPAPADPYPVDLNVFNGTSGNGTWKLFIDDQESSDDGFVGGGWSLTLTAPVNTITPGTPTLNKKNGTAVVPVKVGDAGQLTLSGNGVKPASASKAVAVGGPGTVNVVVAATGKKKKKLNSKGKVKVSPTITFTPNGGAAKSETLSLTLKKKIKK